MNNGVPGAVRPVSGSISILPGIACPTEASCVAVGNADTGVFVPVESGVPATPLPIPGTTQLFGVACISPTSCIAVGLNSAHVGVVVTITVTMRPLCTITGAGDILGTEGDDVICGSPGPDRISGGGGNDMIFGGDGNDQISGGTGNDELFGEGGVDRLSGGDGDDILHNDDGASGDYSLGGNHLVGDTCTDDPGDFRALCEGDLTTTRS